MSAATFVPAVLGTGSAARPGMIRLTLVEMRKMVDTRGGKWLVGFTVAVSLAIVGLLLSAGDDPELAVRAFFEYCQYPVGLVLPVLGILLVTGEWSQRTALTTFTLVPQRQRIAVAKLLAATAFALVSLIASLAASALGNVLAIALYGGERSWSLPDHVLGGAALFQVLSVVMGVAFGMLLMNPALAVVVYFAAPTVLGIVRGALPGADGLIGWLDINAAVQPLVSGGMTTHGWQQLAVSATVWVLAPLVLGMIRLQRREVT